MDLAGAISGVGALLQIAEVAIKARDDAKAKQAIADVQIKLLDLSTAALAMAQTNISLTDEIRLLKEENQQLQMKASEREGYALAEISPGVYAYKSQPVEGREDSVPHYVCQPCYDKGVKSVLRYFNNKGDSWTSPHKVWQCPVERSHEFSSFS